MAPADLQRRLETAAAHERNGRTLKAESLYLSILEEAPRNVAALRRLAHFALTRRDTPRATALLRLAIGTDPQNAQLEVDLAVAHMAVDEVAEATEVLQRTVEKAPSHFPAWLLLGEIRDSVGDRPGALRAWYQAVTRAQRAGQWIDQGSTPPPLLESVIKAIERVRTGRRELFQASYEDLRQTHGPQALKRVDRALSGYLREWDATPPDSRQRPKFFFFPDIPNQPYHDPFLQPWAKQLQAAFPVIKGEALELLREEKPFQNFIDFKEGDPIGEVLGGDALDPTWEAFFFYRHGVRFDANHQRCPKTSAVLDSIELCRVSEQAPEILFSVLRPKTHIMPHHGVTNTRLVMHLPLIVPEDCALNLVDAGEHRWKEGELVMFDDTYSHEAWNRSNSTRIVVLMDCWNPYLTAVEKLAVKQLIETISGLQFANRSREARVPAGSAGA
ncbi:MAG: aspartyl/asparaginyl beta-hydroxylase domain-containing protein [Caldimonas sp.]